MYLVHLIPETSLQNGEKVGWWCSTAAVETGIHSGFSSLLQERSGTVWGLAAKLLAASLVPGTLRSLLVGCEVCAGYLTGFPCVASSQAGLGSSGPGQANRTNPTPTAKMPVSR